MVSRGSEGSTSVDLLGLRRKRGAMIDGVFVFYQDCFIIYSFDQKGERANLGANVTCQHPAKKHDVKKDVTSIGSF